MEPKIRSEDQICGGARMNRNVQGYDFMNPLLNGRPLPLEKEPSPMRIVYMVIEDAKLSGAVQAALESKGVPAVSLHVPGECAAYARADALSCLLLDEESAGTDFSVLSHLLRNRDSPPIILLTQNGDVPSCVRALRNGAHDYLTLPLMTPRLFQAVASAFDTDQALRAQRQAAAELRSRWESLTTREAEIMHYAVRGFLNKQTAAELNITENTVQVHRGRVMRKMHAASLAELVCMSLRLSS